MSEEELTIFKENLKFVIINRIQRALDKEDFETLALNINLYGKIFGGEMTSPAGTPDKFKGTNA